MEQAVSIALLRQGCVVLGVVYAYAAPDNAGDLFFWAEGMHSVHRNNDRISRQWPAEPSQSATALISQDADRAAEVNAELLYPMRFRSVPSIAYRLALVAAGEGDLAVSLNGPTGWDIAGGHALLLGAGANVFNQEGEVVHYDSTGQPLRAMSYCFGGPHGLVKQYAARKWRKVFEAGTSQPAQKSLCFLIPGKVIVDPSILSRAQGCLLGQFAGAAIASAIAFLREKAQGWKVTSALIETSASHAGEVIDFIVRHHSHPSGGTLRCVYNELELRVDISYRGSPATRLPKIRQLHAAVPGELEDEEAAAYVGLRNFLQGLAVDRQEIKARKTDIVVRLFYAV